MTASEHSELVDIIDRTFSHLGGVGTLSDVLDVLTIAGTVPDHLREYLVREGLATKVGAYFRRKDRDKGLPIAPEVDEHGTHMQLELMDVGEYRYVIRKYVERGNANRAMAQAFADACYEHHGVRIDISAAGDSAAAV